MSKYYKLDNAAQIYPIVSTKRQQNSFRLAVVLKEIVDETILKKAVNTAISRYQFFNVQLKKGLFWFYFDSNEDMEVPIFNDGIPYIQAFNLDVQNKFLFKIAYHDKRIVLEMFHALSDANGAIEFLKTILLYYFNFKGYEIKSEGKVIDHNYEQLFDEEKDEFKNYYDKNIKSSKQEKKAYHIKAQQFKTPNKIDIISAIMDSNKVKEVAKKYDLTITQYISALMYKAIVEEYGYQINNDKNITLFIPINVRKFFDTRSLRNFALFIRLSAKKDELTLFDNIVNKIKDNFNEELTKEKVLARISQNIKFEKTFIRFVPLLIKIPFARMIFSHLSNDPETMKFSNLGNVNCPSEFSNHVSRFEFLIPVTKTSPVSLSCVTYNNKMVLTFVSRLLERKIQKNIINTLSSHGIDIELELTDIEVMQ